MAVGVTGSAWGLWCENGVAVPRDVWGGMGAHSCWDPSVSAPLQGLAAALRPVDLRSGRQLLEGARAEGT